MIDAGRCDWKDVEPAIFGTLLERALDPRERHKLGAHFTPRAYVERLVVPTIIEPVRDDWEAARAASLAEANAGRLEQARGEARKFLDGLTATKVLDPACGTGNFLYVSMVKLKEIEAEARDWLAQLGEGQTDLEHMERTVDTGRRRAVREPAEGRMAGGGFRGGQSAVDREQTDANGSRR